MILWNLYQQIVGNLNKGTPTHVAFCAYLVCTLSNVSKKCEMFKWYSKLMSVSHAFAKAHQAQLDEIAFTWTSTNTWTSVHLTCMLLNIVSKIFNTHSNIHPCHLLDTTFVRLFVVNFTRCICSIAVIIHKNVFSFCHHPLLLRNALVSIISWHKLFYSRFSELYMYKILMIIQNMMPLYFYYCFSF